VASEFPDRRLLERVVKKPVVSVAGSAPAGSRRLLRVFRGASISPLCVVSVLLSVLLSASLAGCASLGERPAGEVANAPCETLVVDAAVYRRAEVERAKLLDAEVRRLRVDLKQAEEALVIAESGMRGTYSRVDAISALAETRIEVERVAAQAPWGGPDLEEANRKLEEAAAQIEQEHFGAALFFIYRARRAADKVALEAKAVATTPGARFVIGDRVNLRAGPTTSATVVAVLGAGIPVFPERRQESWVLVRASTGVVGWVHQSLLRD
jgi:hypothetical protein